MEDGNVSETQEELETNLNSYFSNLMKEPKEDREESQREVFRHIPKIIIDEHNHILGKSIEMTKVEVDIN